MLKIPDSSSFKVGAGSRKKSQKMKTLTCLSAWLGLLPFPLDQALRLPLQKNKSRVVSRKWGNVTYTILGNLSKDVSERCTSTGRETFSLFICLDAIQFVLLTFVSLIKTIYPRVSTKTYPGYQRFFLASDEGPTGLRPKAEDTSVDRNRKPRMKSLWNPE